jgi:DmsE family decaheme c-type cytochrome
MIIKRTVSITVIVGLLQILPFSSPFSSEKVDPVMVIEKSGDCLDCHDDMAGSLDNSTHRLSSNASGDKIIVGCISCHDGWAKHLEEPSAENIGNPEKHNPFDQANICGNCHQSPHQASMISFDPHGIAGVACLTCHTIHNNTVNMLLSEKRDQFCVSCHSDVASEFQRRSAHPYESGNIDCVDCHIFGETERADRAVGMNWTCQNCHAEHAGPFIYEHPVTSKHLVEGSGCIECHQPHGSNNDRLINQPGNGVCLQCHNTPPGHLTNHSGLGSKLACLECHTEIHGSYDNRLFLDPSLGSKLFPDCYQSGCHIQN